MKRKTSRTNGTILHIGTLNARGLLRNEKLQQAAEDMTQYKMDAMTIQETHLKGTGVTKVKAHSGEKYVLYHTGTVKDSNHGVSIMVKENIKLDFEVVSENICIGRAKLDDKTKREHVIISAYAPTHL